ncbi:MAG: hypoxanthine phosphoribosyltransferase [Oscillospiraceae bacterium]|nr:hypoxanthine phosphoribosyltransferase [Oscillospiraceae bacterium]
MYCPNEIDRILISEEEIKQKVAEMGRVLTKEYEGKNPLFICVLKGSVVFFADLIREMHCPLEINFLKASSYGNSSVSSGNVKLDVGAGIDFKGRHVVIVEDILDTARTLYALKNELLTREPASLKLVTLLDKPSRRVVKGFTADYEGFDIDDLFVVGYGLDYDERFRNLPYVAVLKPEVYENT